MERIELNPNRLKWALEDRGASLEELAAAVGAGLKTLTKAMGGEAGLTFPQLRNIAKFFNRGVLFFVEEEPVVEETLRSPQFRTLTNQMPDVSPELRSLIERAERRRDIYLGLRDDLDPEDRGGYKPPNVAGLQPVQAASVARKWLALGEQNDFRTFRSAIESKGILVLMAVGYFGEWRLPEDSSVAGFSIFDPRCPVILVKKHRGEARQSFTLMHELGHILLHQTSFMDQEQDLYAMRGREREANLFAGHLLVPDAFLQQISDIDRPQQPELIDDWLKQWHDRWGVSSEVILIRLIESGRLEQGEYEAYRAWRDSIPIPEPEGGSRAYRHREPLHLFGSRYVRTVLDAMSADRISLNKASSFLDNIKVSDVHRLEDHLAGL